MKKRIWELDMLRGIFMILIMLFNLWYDLVYLYGVAKLVLCARGDAQFETHTFALFGTTGDACGSTVVAGGENTLILDDDGAYMAVFLETTGPFADGIGQVDKTFIPFIHKTYGNS